MLTVALSERRLDSALAHATRAAELSVVRTTGATTDDNDPTTYRPAPVAPGVTP